jgi:hypothetical protein
MTNTGGGWVVGQAARQHLDQAAVQEPGNPRMNILWFICKTNQEKDDQY